MAKRSSPAATPFVRFLFLLYCGVMLWLLFGRSSGWTENLSYWEKVQQNMNVTPLLTIRNYIHVVLYSSNASLVRHCFINLAGNILLFIPAGWLLPRIWVRLRRFFPFFFTCAIAILLVELFQLFTLLGSFDVDDLILNLLGMILGYLFYMILHRKK